MRPGDIAVQDLRRHAQLAPDRPAIVCGDERLSYGELESLANRYAALFRAAGLVRGEHIATLLGNRPDGLAVAWAAWRSGLYLTPLSTALAVAELRPLVADCGARLVITEAAVAELAEPLAADAAAPLQWWSLNGRIAGCTPIEARLATADATPAAAEPPGALMLYTSGTGGSPKGVIRPLLPADWRGTPPFAADLIELFGLGGDDVRYLSTAPLYHAAPLRVALAVTAGGGTVFVMERFDATRALDLLQSEAITHSQWVPAMFQRLLALPAAQRAAFTAPAHRRAIHGAAPCPQELKRRMIDWWGPILLEYYSGTEGIGLTLIDSAEALQRPGSVGRARKGSLHIVDEQGGELSPGRRGLVCFAGGAPFEYHQAPDKTAACTLPQGWQTFGDIGHVDADGYLYLSDRRDDLIISGGVNLYPQEIEDAIREVPSVRDCAVVGLADERFGERPVAFVVPDGEAPAQWLDTVRRHCAQRLGRYKQPTAFHVLDALPRSPTGKLLRRRLRELIPPSQETLP
ncbi:MAG TPA: AMP-binding protein [Methylibium sp.]|nr:AMP-binding protein [Methylibium sp.]